MSKKTFMVETGWYTAISQLPEPEQLALYKRLFLFHSGEHNEVPLTTELQKTIWSFIEDVLKKRKKRSESPDWKKDFTIYLADLTNAYNTLLNDSAFIKEKEKFYPNLDVKLSIEKAFTTYWSKEAGWKNKKKAATQNIDWRKTFSNALDQRFNHVYKSLKTIAQEPEKQCKWMNLYTGQTRTDTHKQYLIDKNRFGSENIRFIEDVK